MTWIDVKITTKFYSFAIFVVFSFKSMAKRVASCAIDFTKTKHVKSDDLKLTRKDKRVWRDFTFRGEEVPDKATLTKISANEKFAPIFDSIFKSMYLAETIKLDKRTPYSTFYCKITFNCSDEEEDLLSAFFVDEGFEAEVSKVIFNQNK